MSPFSASRPQRSRWPLVLITALLSGSAWATPVAPPTRVVVQIDGMVCGGCQQNVSAALDALPFVARTVASFAAGGACLELSGAGDTDAIEAAILDIGKYSVSKIERVDACPRQLRPGVRADPWDDTGGFDVVTVSRGGEVTLKDQLVADKFTVIDFGAPWCGPCHAAAATLREYLADHDDVAIRAISLDARDPKRSYALPVARQHLKWVAGIPYFLVYNPAGKVIYKGAEVSSVTQAIDTRRVR